MTEKSRLNEIQSKIETLIFHYGNSEERLKKELEEILKILEYEQNLRSEITNSLSGIIGKL